MNNTKIPVNFKINNKSDDYQIKYKEDSNSETYVLATSKGEVLNNVVDSVMDTNNTLVGFEFYMDNNQYFVDVSTRTKVGISLGTVDNTITALTPENSTTITGRIELSNRPKNRNKNTIKKIK